MTTLNKTKANISNQQAINNLSPLNRKEIENPSINSIYNNSPQNTNNNAHESSSITFPIDIYTPLLNIAFNHKSIGVNKCGVMLSDLKQTIMNDLLGNTWYGNELEEQLRAYVFMADRVMPHTLGKNRVTEMFEYFRYWLVSLFLKNLNFNLRGV